MTIVFTGRASFPETDPRYILYEVVNKILDTEPLAPAYPLHFAFSLLSSRVRVFFLFVFVNVPTEPWYETKEREEKDEKAEDSRNPIERERKESRSAADNLPIDKPISYEVVVSILPVTFFDPCVSPVETCRAIFLNSVQKVHRVSLTEIPIRARFSIEPEDLSSDSHAFSSKRRIS